MSTHPNQLSLMLNDPPTPRTEGEWEAQRAEDLEARVEEEMDALELVAWVAEDTGEFAALCPEDAQDPREFSLEEEVERELARWDDRALDEAAFRRDWE